MVDSYEMDFMKGNVISVKVDKMYNILKSASHSLFYERWRWNWMIKVFGGVCHSMSMRLLRPSFINVSLHLVRDAAAEKEFDVEI